MLAGAGCRSSLRGPGSPDGGRAEERMNWLIFSYSLPTHPSRARVFVWRQLKKLGAVNFQTVWVAPYSRERVQEFEKLIQSIEAFQGTGLLFAGRLLSGAEEARLIQAFADSRNEEYQEIIDRCEAYFQEIESEIRRQNFIFAEVEENEEELEKLKQWFKKVDKRDVIKASLRKTALEKIKACERLFDDFARRVYERAQNRGD
jgi:hypothetical protein